MADGSLADAFATAVQEQLSRRAMSINRLADFAGLGRGYVSELLRGEKVPTLTTVEKIAAALEMPPCELLCGPARSSQG